MTETAKEWYEYTLAESMTQVVTEIAGKPVTRGQLAEKFDLIKNEDHWKNPINKTIDKPSDNDLEMLHEAVHFFTGSCLTTYPRDDGRLHCEADGYFLTIGA